MAYPDLYRRSIFFEILSLDQNGRPQTLLDSFAFTMPPSSISIMQPQRITATPTPGGYFVDNYGLDGAKISISGETGNEEQRLTILGPGKAPRTLTGQEAWFEFRDRIQRASLRTENYSMRFYDLSNKGVVNIFRNTTDENSLPRFTEAWEVVLDESGSNRTSSKPFFYPYSINMTGIRPLGVFDPSSAKNAIKFLSSVQDGLDSAFLALSSASVAFQDFLNGAYEYFDSITDIFNTIGAISNQLTTFSGSFLEFEQQLGGLGSDVLSASSDVINSGLQIMSFPYDALEVALQQAVTLRTQTAVLLIEAKADGKAVLDKYDWDKIQDDVSILEASVFDVEKEINNLVLTGKQDASYEPIGGVSIDGVVTSVYGYQEFIVQGNTRLDVIARDFLGDPELKEVISSINGIYSNDELVPGDVLRLPVLEPDTRFANNAVYNLPEETDILGRDAMVDDDGRFVVTTSDYALTSGMETVLQAIGFRLDEKKGRQVRDGSYGIVAQIGAALSGDAPFEYLSTSLKETLVQDPRITDVYGLNIYGSGDNITLEFKFDTITREAQTYSEGIL